MRVTKVASTPANPAVALVRGVRAILGEWGAGVDDLAVLAHGTTVATNALLQGEIAGLGLIVTDGFRHILEIARQAVPEGYGNSYFWVKPERIVPLRYVREVGGRLNFLGEELRPLDEASVRAAARFFREAGITAIGICLIHSYANPAHERRAAEIVREEYPDCTLSLSCDVLPEYREYERAVTTLVDAFIKPHMSRYLDRIRDELGPELNQKPFLVMQSSGGVASPDQVMRKPITTALSGPAAGALGSAVIAELAGYPDLVTLDAGGTSTDLCLIEGAKPKVTNGGRVGRFPVRIPMLDIKTIGTGGGSIAFISREGKLKSRTAQRRRRARPDVLSERRRRADHHRCQSRPRPHSAGADRRRHPSRRLARAPRTAKTGRAPARQSQRRAIGRRHHRDRQLGPGQRHPANDHPARHRSERVCALVVRRLRAGAIAGGDGIDGHEDLPGAAEPRQSVGVRAIGRRLAHRPHHHQGDARGSDRAADRCRPLRGAGKGCRRTLEKDGIAPSRIALVREADVRYAGQSMEVRVPAPSGQIDAAFIAALIDAFHAAHLKTFGYNYGGQQKVELVNFCVSAFGMIERPSIPELKKSGAPPQPATRPVYFDGAYRDTPVFARASLAAGSTLDGPAIVEEFGSTTVVFPRQRLIVDSHGILIIGAAGKADGAPRS